jgi:hypothetical protein
LRNRRKTCVARWRNSSARSRKLRDWRRKKRSAAARKGFCVPPPEEVHLILPTFFRIPGTRKIYFPNAPADRAGQNGVRLGSD